MKKPRPARLVLWLLAVAVTLFACHASHRLLNAARNQRYFYFHEGLATFAELELYAVYLRMPVAYNSCINRLRKIDGAIQQWALEHSPSADYKLTWNDLSPYLGNERLQCPQGGVYLLGTYTNLPRCTVRDHKLVP
jgi:hypothetical protein